MLRSLKPALSHKFCIFSFIKTSFQGKCWFTHSLFFVFIELRRRLYLDLDQIYCYLYIVGELIPREHRELCIVRMPV